MPALKALEGALRALFFLSLLTAQRKDHALGTHASKSVNEGVESGEREAFSVGGRRRRFFPSSSTFFFLLLLQPSSPTFLSVRAPLVTSPSSSFSSHHDTNPLYHKQARTGPPRAGAGRAHPQERLQGLRLDALVGARGLAAPQQRAPAEPAPPAVRPLAGGRGPEVHGLPAQPPGLVEPERRGRAGRGVEVRPRRQRRAEQGRRSFELFFFSFLFLLFLCRQRYPPRPSGERRAPSLRLRHLPRPARRPQVRRGGIHQRGLGRQARRRGPGGVRGQPLLPVAGQSGQRRGERRRPKRECPDRGQRRR